MTSLTSVELLGNSVAHSFLQLAIGMPIGVAVDYGWDKLLMRGQEALAQGRFLPSAAGSARIRNAREAVLSLLAVAGQIITSGFVNALFVSYLTSQSESASDPNFGAVFVLIFFECQARLMARISQLIEYVNVEVLRAVSRSKSLFEPQSQGTDANIGINTQTTHEVAKNAKLPLYGHY